MGDVVSIRGGYSGLFWQWNEEEDAALQYMPHSDQVLYLRGLRRHMDFSTGVVGVRRRVSYQQFSELLEEHRARGSTAAAQRFGREQIRAALRRLEAAGLVVRVNQGGAIGDAMVFRLPLAHLVLVRANEEPHRNTTEGTTQETSDNSTTYESGATQEPHGMNPTPQYNNNNSPKGECAEPAVAAPAGRGVGDCPHAEILALWAELLPQCRQPKRGVWVKSQSARNLANRWKQAADIEHSSGERMLYHDRASGLLWWRKFFSYLATRCPILTADDTHWFDLHWLAKKQNFLKALDKKYEDGQ